MTRPIRIALLAGRRRSPASLLMLTALNRLRPEIEVAAVLSTSEFRWRRLRDWYRRFGVRALAKGLREFGVASVGDDPEHETLRQRLIDWNVAAKSLPALCREFRIPFHVVRDINAPSALKLLDRAGCDYGVYSGAGILRPPLLDRFPGGVLNLHCGSLPAIRGMNGVEWNLFHGRRPEVTLHLIDSGIDTGPILASRTVAPDAVDRLGRLRGRTILAGIDLLAESLPQIGTMPRHENPKEEGRQYFAMAEPLKCLIEDRLRAA